MFFKSCLQRPKGLGLMPSIVGSVEGMPDCFGSTLNFQKKKKSFSNFVSNVPNKGSRKRGITTFFFSRKRPFFCTLIYNKITVFLDSKKWCDVKDTSSQLFYYSDYLADLKIVDFFFYFAFLAWLLCYFTRDSSNYKSSFLYLSLSQTKRGAPKTRYSFCERKYFI